MTNRFGLQYPVLNRLSLGQALQTESIDEHHERLDRIPEATQIYCIITALQVDQLHGENATEQYTLAEEACNGQQQRPSVEPCCINRARHVERVPWHASSDAWSFMRSAR